MRFAQLIAAVALLSGCAVLHHVQIGEIDNRDGARKKPFDIKVSEMGINIDEAASVAKAFGGKKESEAIESVQQIVSMFQMGPRTGNIVFVDNFARNIGKEIWNACPSGRITGVNAIREMRKYPVISGEIVKVTGYCLEKK